MVTLLFPVAKIIVTIFFIGYFIWLYFHWKNWTFLMPSVGASCNLAAVLANGGTMPTLNPIEPLDPSHSIMGPHAHLKPLCDLYPIGQLGVFSFGDAVCVLIWPLTIMVYYWYTQYRKVRNDSHS